MMRIPRAIAVVLGMRQLSPTLPDSLSFCTPQCPACKVDVTNFNISSSCVANSSFIANCGSCQTCVSTYNLETGYTPEGIQIQDDITMFLNMCQNTTISSIIQAYESQASKVSVWAMHPTPTGDPTTTSLPMSITAAPTSTPTYESGNQTNVNITTPTPTPSVPPSNTAGPPLSRSWVVGPVAGSVLGMSTVFIVIFFTRRKHRRENMIASEEDPKPFDNPDSPSTRASSAAGDVVQLHSESLEPPKEMENTEIYEMAAPEPVGTELNTPVEARLRIRLNGDGIVGDMEEGEEQYTVHTPLPLSPLPEMFRNIELRDQRMGRSESLRHETYYHP